MSESPAKGKTRKKLNLDELLTKIVELLVRYEPSQLSFSRVSQLTKVPRSTLYYYFGNSRESMIEQAAKFGMESFVQLMTLDKVSAKATGKSKEHKDWKSFQRARMQITARLMRHYPWGPELYFKYRNDQSRLGERIRHVESEYLRKLEQAWKQFHDGKEPDRRALRLSSYLKLGLMWGMSCDRDLWFTEAKTVAEARRADQALDTLLDTMTEIAADVMKRRFDAI